MLYLRAEPSTIFLSGATMKSVLRSNPVLTFAALMSFSAFANASLSDLQNRNTSDFLMTTAPTGCQPKGLRSDRDGRYAYVAEMCGKKINGARVATVSIYNLKTMKLEKTIVTPSGAQRGVIGNAEVTFTLDDNYILASRVEGDKQSAIFPGYGMVTAIDARSQEIKEFIPVNGTGTKIIETRPMVTGDKREIVYVANYFSDDISVLDVSNMQDDLTTNGTKHFLTKIRLHSAFVPATAHGATQIGPRGIAFTPDGHYGIVDNSTTGSLFIVDAVNHRQIAELGPIPEDLGSVPLRQQQGGKAKNMNVRHIVLTKDGKTAYLSHMRGDAISRINVDLLISTAVKAKAQGQTVLPSETWKELLIPFANGKSVVKVPHYPADHPNFPNKDWDLVRPNTIVLDPISNRYLYISCRTDTNENYNVYSENTHGKVDVLDTQTGEVIFSLVGGSQPTALEVTPDNTMLISGGFKDSKLYFFDIKKLLDLYER